MNPFATAVLLFEVVVFYCCDDPPPPSHDDQVSCCECLANADCGARFVSGALAGDAVAHTDTDALNQCADALDDGAAIAISSACFADSVCGATSDASARTNVGEPCARSRVVDEDAPGDERQQTRFRG